MGENKEGRGQSLRERIRNDFTYHAPDEEHIRRHTKVRNLLSNAAHSVSELTPPGREQSLALTKLEEAMFWANAGIAREDPPQLDHVFVGPDRWLGEVCQHVDPRTLISCRKPSSAHHLRAVDPDAVSENTAAESGDPGPPRTEALVGDRGVEVSITAIDMPSLVDAVMGEIDRRRRMEPLR